MIITIDGPTGSGKSSAARGLALILNYYCLSSGSLYRALAYILIHNFDYTLEQLEHPLEKDIRQALDPKKCIYHLEKDSCGWISYEKKDITPFLKTDTIAQGASIIATNKDVRDKLSVLQRTLAQGKNIVLEGRDSGSVVFENADVKFYITAEFGQRAQRWQHVQKKRGEQITFEQAKEHIKERDHRDQNREIAPLIIPKDSIVIDNTHLSLEQTIEKMLEYVQ